MRHRIITAIAVMMTAIMATGTAFAAGPEDGSAGQEATWEEGAGMEDGSIEEDMYDAAEDEEGGVPEDTGDVQAAPEDTEEDTGDIEEPMAVEDAEDLGNIELDAGGPIEEEAVEEDTGELASSAIRDEAALRSYILERAYALDSYIDLTAYDASYEEVESIKREAANKEPALMYYIYSIEYRYETADGKRVKVPIGLRNSSLTDETRSLIYAYRKKCDQIVAGMDPSWSDFEKILYIHDWLCSNNTCISHVKSDPMHAWEHSVIGPILKGNSVCQGYSYAFLALMNRCGIKCYIVVGFSINHMWNLVELNGRLYHLDIMNDSKKDNGNAIGACSHSYFLKSDKWMMEKTRAMNGSTGEVIPSRYSYLIGDKEYTQADGLANDTYYDRTPFDRARWGLEEGPFQYYKGYWYSSAKRIYAPLESYDLYKFRYNGKELEFVGTALTKAWDDDYQGSYIHDSRVYTLSSDSIIQIDMDTQADAGCELPVKGSSITSFYMDREGSLHYKADGKEQVMTIQARANAAAKASDGWASIDGKTVYYKGGSLLKGWQGINGFRYYFGSDGFQYTGWHTISGKKYYFWPSTLPGPRYKGIIATGWQTIGGKKYYFGTDGAMKTGWQTVTGKKYYLGTDGAVRTGWQTISDRRYYFGTDGAMRTGWQTISGKRYYFGTNGIMRTGWQSISGKSYYFSSSGIMRTGWQDISGSRYYFSSDGAMKTGWATLSEKTYYFGTNGYMRTFWQVINGYRYYFGSDGAQSLGLRTISGRLYYFWPKTENSHYKGTMARSRTVKAAGASYKVNAEGIARKN